MSYEKGKGQEIEITEKDMIVSTTDRKGILIYANDIFCDIAGYSRKDVIGKPHNMIRHPEMPKAVFKLLWQRVLKGHVIYAFVKNLAKNGDYYWVKAYVKPILKNGEVVKITSYRKPLNNYAKNFIENLYSILLDYEKNHSVDESLNFLQSYLDERNLTYDQFIDRLSLEKNVENIQLRNIDYNKQKNKHIIFKEYVVNAVKNKQFDELENTTNSVCEFGEWCKSLEKEQFTSDDSWKKMINYHEKFHSMINEYIHRSKNNINAESNESMLNNINIDINNIFNNLTIVRNRY